MYLAFALCGDVHMSLIALDGSIVVRLSCAKALNSVTDSKSL